MCNSLKIVAFTFLALPMALISPCQSTPPPVCVRFNLRNFEDEIWANAQESKLQMENPVPSFKWNSKLTIKDKGWDFGTLSGFTLLSVESVFGRVVVIGEVDFKYVQNNGYWPFFNSVIGSTMGAHPYLEGGATQYGWKASMESTWQNDSSAGRNFPCSGASGAYQGIGGLFDWPYSSSPMQASGTEIAVDGWGTWSAYGTTYWPAWNSFNCRLSARFGSTGPTLPHFVVSGKLKMKYTFEVYKLQGVHPVAEIDNDGRPNREYYTSHAERRYYSTSYDPDNPGEASRKGILADQWTLILPDGSEVSYLGPVFYANFKKNGVYKLKLRSFDDEGMSDEVSQTIVVIKNFQIPSETSVGTLG